MLCVVVVKCYVLLLEILVEVYNETIHTKVIEFPTKQVMLEECYVGFFMEENDF
jgi:hypothetical protein